MRITGEKWNEFLKLLDSYPLSLGCEGGLRFREKIWKLVGSRREQKYLLRYARRYRKYGRRNVRKSLTCARV